MRWIIPELAAERLGLNFSTFRKYLRSGRVSGAERVQGKNKTFWVIPTDISVADIDVPIAGRPRKDKDDLIIRPEKPVSQVLAKIKIEDNTVSVLFPERRDDFGKIVKGLGYIWQQPYWLRQVRPESGSPIDRAAELGRHLLVARFCVTFDSALARQKALNGDYTKDRRRWVLVVGKGEHKHWFALEWPRADDLYNKAMKIHGAQYGPPYVVVPPENYEEVLDFAELHKFQLTRSAQRMVEQMRQMWERALVVDIRQIDVEPDDIETKPRPETPEGIDDEFADEPL